MFPSGLIGFGGLLDPIREEGVDRVPRVKMALAALRLQQFCGIALRNPEESAEVPETQTQELIIAIVADEKCSLPWMR